MGGGVGRVVELAGHPGRGQGAQQLLRLGDGALHALGAGGQLQPGAQCGEQVAPLQAHGLGHGEDDLIALDGGDIAQAHAGVAAGGLHDNGARLEQTLGLRVLNHVLGGPVLGGGKGIEALQLGQQGGGQVVGGFVPLQAEQGGVADEVHKGVGDLHFISSLFSMNTMKLNQENVPALPGHFPSF